MLADLLLVGIWKAANPGASLVFLGADWLIPGNDDNVSMCVSAETVPTVRIDAYSGIFLVF